MNFEAKWWLVIMTVIGNFWFLSAIPKKRTSIKQRWKKDTDHPTMKELKR